MFNIPYYACADQKTTIISIILLHWDSNNLYYIFWYFDELLFISNWTITHHQFDLIIKNSKSYNHVSIAHYSKLDEIVDIYIYVIKMRSPFSSRVINMIWKLIAWVGLVRVSVLFINHEMGIINVLIFTNFVIYRVQKSFHRKF